MCTSFFDGGFDGNGSRGPFKVWQLCVTNSEICSAEFEFSSVISLSLDAECPFFYTKIGSYLAPQKLSSAL